MVRINSKHPIPYPYCIPMMKPQATLLALDSHPQVADMIDWCRKNCEEAWSMQRSLERRWYPEFLFESRWDAAAFMKKFKKYM